MRPGRSPAAERGRGLRRAELVCGGRGGRGVRARGGRGTFGRLGGARLQQRVRAQQRAVAALGRVQRVHVQRARRRGHQQPRRARHAADTRHTTHRRLSFSH